MAVVLYLDEQIFNLEHNIGGLQIFFKLSKLREGKYVHVGGVVKKLACLMFVDVFFLLGSRRYYWPPLPKN